jgi:hypothetical protein
MAKGGLTPDMIVQGSGPEDWTTATNNGTYISLKDYPYCDVHIFNGDVAGGTPAVTVTQAQDTSGTGAKALTFTKYFRPGQKLVIGSVSGTFSSGETVTGGTSSNTAKVVKISSDHLWVATLTGTTTWTDGETLTGGTSGATATLSGTGQDEDVCLEETASSNTFDLLAITNKHWIVPVDASMLDQDNDFDCIRVNVAQASGSHLGAAVYHMKDSRYQKYPQQSVLGAIKVSV